MATGAAFWVAGRIGIGIGSKTGVSRPWSPRQRVESGVGVLLNIVPGSRAGLAFDVDVAAAAPLCLIDRRRWLRRPTRSSAELRIRGSAADLASRPGGAKPAARDVLTAALFGGRPPVASSPSNSNCAHAHATECDVAALTDWCPLTQLRPPLHYSNYLCVCAEFIKVLPQPQMLVN